jgi:hypothetical protein
MNFFRRLVQWLVQRSAEPFPVYVNEGKGWVTVQANEYWDCP